MPWGNLKCCEMKLLPSVFYPVAPTLRLEPPRSKDRKARETLVTGFPAALSALAYFLWVFFGRSSAKVGPVPHSLSVTHQRLRPRLPRKQCAQPGITLAHMTEIGSHLNLRWNGERWISIRFLWSCLNSWHIS